MRKKVVAFFLFLFLFSLFAVSSSAVEEDILEDFYSAVPNEYSELCDGDELISNIGFEAIVADVLAALSDTSGAVASFFMLLFGFSVLIVASCGASELGIVPKTTVGPVGEAAACSIASAVIFSSLCGVTDTVRDSIVAISDFFGSLLPILTAISTASGAVSSAAVQATNMNITLAIVGRVCVDGLLPLSFSLFALALVSSLGGGGIASVAKGIKSIFMWGVGIACAVSSAAVAMQSVVASASDSAALRAARYAASGLIPIVGSTVASALGTLSGGLAFIKSTVGATSIAVILSLALAPLLSLLLYRLAFSVCIIFLEFLDSMGGVRCFSAFRSALDAIISVYALSVLLCTVELVIFIKSGVNVF